MPLLEHASNHPPLSLGCSRCWAWPWGYWWCHFQTWAALYASERIGGVDGQTLNCLWGQHLWLERVAPALLLNGLSGDRKRLVMIEWLTQINKRNCYTLWFVGLKNRKTRQIKHIFKMHTRYLFGSVGSRQVFFHLLLQRLTKVVVCGILKVGLYL